MSFPRTPEEGRTRPLTGATRRDMLRRAAVPLVLLWVGVVGVGLLVVGPLDGLPGEVAVNEELQERRTPLLDDLTAVWSLIGGTRFIVGACVLAVAVLWWRTRQWRRAFVPAVAISVQATVFVTAAAVVGRERPEVEQLDEAPPTSGFPSGHVGASTAFYLTLALLASRLRSTALRWAVTVAVLLVPVLVAFARMYRGMHHPSDVVVGALNGVACALLAWRYLHSRVARDESPGALAAGDGTPADDEVRARAVADADPDVKDAGTHAPDAPAPVATDDGAPGASVPGAARAGPDARDRR